MWCEDERKRGIKTMKKIKNFLFKNFWWILLTLGILVLLGIMIIPLCVYIAKAFWDIALNAPMPQY